MNAVQEVRSLYGGISSQHPNLRLENQVEDSVNCIHTVDRGVLRRNPTELVIGNTGIENDVWTYSYNRGSNDSGDEEYMFVYDSVNALRAVNLDTGAITGVAGLAGLTYLALGSSYGNVNNRFSATTVKDTTYIVNRSVETALNATNDVDETAKVAYIWIQNTDAISGYTFTATVNGASATSTGQLTTYTVASDLATQISGIENVTATSSQNIVEITMTDGSDIASIDISDSFGDQASSVLWKKITSSDDLPATMGIYRPSIKVGDLNDAGVYYWLYYNGTIWTEARGPAADYEFDQTTMPHKITRAIDGSFSILPIEWTERIVGDDSMTPAPTFVGERINDVLFFKNRFGVLSESSICFSEVGYYGNFFRTSQVTVLDADVIDAPLDSKKAFELRYVAFLQDEIVIFGSDIQFRISHNGSFTAKTISATQISNYEINQNIEPYSIDDKIFFVTTRGAYSQVHVYTKDGSGLVNRAYPVTQHVSELIDSGVKQIVGSSSNGMIFLRSETELSTLYVYRYMYNGNELAQSAWGKFVFSADIHALHSKGDTLWLALDRQDVIDSDEWAIQFAQWNDTFNWNDNKVWIDSIEAANKNIEKMTIDPIDNELYKDLGQVNYSSDITMSRYIPKINNKNDESSTVYIKTAKVLASDDSRYDFNIYNKKRNKTRIISEFYVSGKRPFIMSNAKDVSISIRSYEGNKLQVNGVLYESKINNRSKII